MCVCCVCVCSWVVDVFHVGVGAFFSAVNSDMAAREEFHRRRQERLNSRKEYDGPAATASAVLCLTHPLSPPCVFIVVCDVMCVGLFFLGGGVFVV